MKLTWDRFRLAVEIGGIATASTPLVIGLGCMILSGCQPRGTPVRPSTADGVYVTEVANFNGCQLYKVDDNGEFLYVAAMNGPGACSVVKK